MLLYGSWARNRWVLQGKLLDASLGVQQFAEGAIALRLQGIVLLLKIPVS